tara:strand:+ start:5552 stop:7084 length:1533 start_codon:yes stop_codon:yes gene_type:complete
MRVLEAGGNAVDAAVAVAFALSVVNPSAGNLGGGGFMLIHLAEREETIALDYRERAPKKSSQDMFLDDEGNVIKGLSLNSTLSAGIPGTVAGLFYAIENFGSFEAKFLIKPSIKLAREGFVLSNFQSNNINKYKKKFLAYKDAKKIFTRSEGFKENDLLIQEDLANTLERILINGKKEFYSGITSKRIIDFYKKNGGIFSQEDFEEYKVKKLRPICGTYRIYKVCSMPPPSSGGIALIQMLNVLENFDISKLDHNSLEYLNILISTMDYAFFDRAMYLGDPEFFEIPQNMLTSKKYALEIFKNIKAKKPAPKANIKFLESEETTHFSIIDKWGNVVSNTYTLNTAYGSGIVPTGTGILMNNEMDDFSLKPGYPNAYGLVGSEANKIEPRKTPLSSMSPIIVFQNNKPLLISGSPGGSTIITTVLQEILNVLDFGMNLEESSKQSRIHYQNLPDIVFHEELKFEIIEILSKRKKLAKRKLGETHSILIHDNNIEAVSDNRRPDGKASTILQ